MVFLENYSIIKDMYRKSELCVKINNKITPTFKSFVGVKQGDDSGF
jgi:hypothetical protein